MASNSNNNKLINALEKNTKAMEQYTNTMTQIMKSSGNATVSKQGKDASVSTSSSKSEATKQRTWVDNLKSSLLSTSKLISGAKQMIGTVQEVDAAMNDLYQVTHETHAKYEQFLTSAASSASKLGISLADLIKQTAAAAKLGLSLEESARLAQTGIVYANISGLDHENAIANLTAAMTAFNIEASDSITIVDKLAALSKQFGGSSGTLGTELAQSASALAAAGNDLDEALALLTAMTNVTQDVSESGNALTVLSMRLSGMKDELTALGQNTDGIESLKQIQQELLSLTDEKVNIFSGTDSDSLKSTYEILQEISGVWNSLNGTNQSALLDMLTGGQDNSNISALLTNISQANQALTASMHSSGSAYQEQEQWMDSLEGKVQEFRASFEALSTTLLDSDLLKFFVDLGTTGVSALNGLANALTPLGTLAAGAGLFAGIQNVGKPKMSGFNLLYV